MYITKEESNDDYDKDLDLELERDRLYLCITSYNMHDCDYNTSECIYLPKNKLIEFKQQIDKYLLQMVDT